MDLPVTIFTMGGGAFHSRKIVLQIKRAKHGVSFETAALVFDDPFHLSVIDRSLNGEERLRTMGQIGGLVILVVAHTYKEQDGEETIRIIPARKANRSKRRHYERKND